MERPWSVIDDVELKLLRELVDEAAELRRGCFCDYDYRCTNCSAVMRVVAKANEARDARR